MEIIKSSDSDFEQLVASSPKVIVKFYADWCGSCKLFAPKFKRMAKDQQYENVTFVEVNAEENPKARELAKVTNLPYFATFKNGNLENTISASKEEAVASLIATLYI